MHVLQFGNNVVAALGGMPRAMADVRKAVGGEIVSLTDPRWLAPADDAVLHVPQSRWPVARGYGWARERALADARRRVEHCDVVLIHGLFRHHYGWASRAAREHRKPYLVFPHGALDPHVFTYRSVQKRLWWRGVGAPAMTHAAGAVFATERERAKAAARLPPGVATHVLPLPVDLPPAGRLVELREGARRRHGIAPAHRALLFLGRLDPVKRVPQIIEAFGVARRDDLHLLVTGPDSPELSALECARRVDPAVRARVHFTGPAYGDAKLGLLAAADGFVNFSAKENFGYALCEALAAGLPAILGPGNDLGHDLAGQGCIWLLARDDVPSLARAISSFAAVPRAQLEDMGQRGIRWVRTCLAPGSFARALAQLCAEAAA